VGVLSGAKGISKEILGDRVDVSMPILDKHYDRRTEERERRRRLAEPSQQLDGSRKSR
jgi:hypothetical protein